MLFHSLWSVQRASLGESALQVPQQRGWHAAAQLSLLWPFARAPLPPHSWALGGRAFLFTTAALHHAQALRETGRKWVSRRYTHTTRD